MDERQTQIREGAGLDESRLNTEFIDFLRKWSTPFLLVLVIIFGGYTLLQRRAEARDTRVDEAFASLNAATSPAALLQIAEEYEDVGAVSEVARLRAADTLMLAVVRGLQPGAALTPAGQLASEEDVATAEDIEGFLAQAEGLYQRVWDEVGAGPIEAWHKIGAGFGMASVAETRGDAETARAWYDRVLSACEEGEAPALKAIAQERLETLDERIETPVLLSRDDLPEAPANPLLSPTMPSPMAPAGPIGPSLSPMGDDAVGGEGNEDGSIPLNLPQIELNVPITPAPTDPAADPAPAGEPEPGSDDPGR